MELFEDLNTAERIALGVLSFIALIVYLRWEGPWEDQRKISVPKCRKGTNAKQKTIDLSSALASISFGNRAPSLRAKG